MLRLVTPSDFIICSGESVFLRDLIEHIFKRLNIDKSKIICDKSLIRNNEIRDIYGDNTNAKEQLDWKYDMSFYDVLDLLIDQDLEARLNKGTQK